MNPPSPGIVPRTRHKQWDDRDQYGQILRGLILSQITQFRREKNRIKKTRISQNIGYLIQVQNSVINSNNEIAQRIEALEEKVFSKKVIER